MTSEDTAITGSIIEQSSRNTPSMVPNSTMFFVTTLSSDLFVYITSSIRILPPVSIM